jgi:hypothetical protein
MEGETSDFERIEIDEINDVDSKVDNTAANTSMSRSKERRVKPPSSATDKTTSILSNMLDMRHILGFLNQSEWVNTLNIGNIMQISPIQREDLIIHRRNEQEISRDSFLETVSI